MYRTTLTSSLGDGFDAESWIGQHIKLEARDPARLSRRFYSKNHLSAPNE